MLLLTKPVPSTLRQLLVIAAAGIVAAVASAPAAGEMSLDPAERYSLDNGLTVILQRDTRVPEVAVWMAVHVGARDEPTGYAGLAHMVEHMLFRESTHTGRLGISGILATIGAEGMNGTTSDDVTSYFYVIPAHKLPQALWIEAERLAFTLPAMSEATFAVEREVVLNERRERGLTGRANVRDILYRSIYPESHIYHAVASEATDEEAFTLDHVRWFVQRWYRPDNATLTLVGDFDVTRVKQTIERYFGDIRPRGARPERAAVDPVELVGQAQLFVSVPRLRPLVTITWNVPCEGDACGGGLVLLREILAGDDAARLPMALVDRAGIASDVAMSIDRRGSHALVSIGIEVTAGEVPRRCVAAVDEVIAEIQSQAPTQERLVAARLGLATSVIAAFEPVLPRAQALSEESDVSGADVLYDPEALLDTLRDITPEDISDLARRTLPLDRRVVLYEQPNRSEESSGRLVRQIGSARGAEDRP